MNLDKRSYLAIVVFSIVYFGYNYYLQTKYPHMGVPQEILNKGRENALETQASVPATSSNSDSPGLTESQQAQQAQMNADSDLADSSSIQASEQTKVIRLPQSELTFENDVASFTLDQDTGGFSSIYLKNYTVSLENIAQVNLVNEALIIQPLTNNEPSPAQSFNAARQGNTVTFERLSGDFKVTHSYTFSESGYGVDFSASFENISSEPRNLKANLLLSDSMPDIKSDGGFLPGIPTGRPALVSSVDDTSNHHDAISYCEDEEEKGAIESSQASNIYVLGLDRHYFVKAFVADGQKFSYALSKTERSANQSCLYNATLGQDFGRVSPGATVNINLKTFFGPKDLSVLKAFDKKLVDTVNLGWFGFISEPLLIGIKWFYGLTGNYGVAIILLTIVIKILFYPLTKSAAIAMHKNKKLQPEMQKLREKYKKDPRKQQQELMAFMSKHQINPMKGCLPMLPQMPVFFALYRILSTAIELRQAPFMGWIVDLSAADPYYVTPLLWGGTMFIQQKLTPTPGMDKNQQKIMGMMPAIFSIMMITVPSGMVLYMLANTVVSIGQQKWLNTKLELEDAATHSSAKIEPTESELKTVGSKKLKGKKSKGGEKPSTAKA